MGNAKWENARHVQNNTTIGNNCWIWKQFNCKHLFIVSNVDIIWFYLKAPEFFLFELEQVFCEIFFDRKSLSDFFVKKLYYTFLQG